jgi:hypothetical protein
VDDLEDVDLLDGRTVTTETIPMSAKVRVAGSNLVVRSKKVGADQVLARFEADGRAVNGGRRPPCAKPVR